MALCFYIGRQCEFMALGFYSRTCKDVIGVCSLHQRPLLKDAGTFESCNNIDFDPSYIWSILLKGSLSLLVT